jgi:DNA-binding MarR family transcriptional regulator
MPTSTPSRPPAETTGSQPWYADIVLPMLLAAGRTTYGRAIRASLVDAGFGDMPCQGSRIVGGIARNGVNLTDVSGLLGVSKQAASQLVDTLVLRGYVERIPDPDDRRRVNVGLTTRGRSAAREIRDAVESIDAALLERVSVQDVAVTRRVLGRLAELADDGAAA